MRADLFMCLLCTVVQVLLDHGASPDLKNAEGLTAMHIAALNGHTKTVEVTCGVKRMG